MTASLLTAKPALNKSTLEEIASAFKKNLAGQEVKFSQAESLADLSEISTSELTIDLRNPSFINGLLTTKEGGVIKNRDLRIQAKNILYVKRKENGAPVHRIEADGDLMIIYKNRVFVGEALEYDFIKKTGLIKNGKTYLSPWYLGGEIIRLKPDGQYSIEEVFLTTCESAQAAWDIHAQKIQVEKKDLLKAEKIRFRLFKLPALWLPSFKINLRKFFTKPVIRYKIDIDKSFLPRVSLRYQVYSWENFALFLRGDYRLGKEGGAAIETEYFPSHKRITFVTQNYLAKDMVPNDPKNRRRYRIQGAYNAISANGKTTVRLTWDKYSDIGMPSDFKSDDFEINTAKKTELIVRNQKKNAISILHALHRANPFNTLKQDLPTVFCHLHPYRWPHFGVTFSNWLNVSYLDYAFSDKLKHEITPFCAFRGQFTEEILKKIDLR
ncbi:MAG: hypothetical protein WC371_02055, partial [Parachlamydiales bacterium]